MSENYAIKIQGVKKQYRLGQIGGGTLQGDLESWWARKRGKEDPNTKIGTDQRLVGQKFMALNGIDLEIPKGQAIGIIGHNGAGKSTLLKLLCRVTAPTEGTIDINGRITSMLEVGTGFHGEMTGRENVYMNGAILGMTKAEIDAKMEDIIEFSEVREFIDTPVKRYSSGMYVKLAFSVAAHLDSEIMIMDEVLAVGDMAFQKKCLDKMGEAASKDGRTVLYVSHNMNTIRQLCNRCVVLDKGKVIFDGDVEEAIGIYMSSSKELSVDNHFTEERNKTYKLDSKVRINRALFLDRNDPFFYQNERINLQLEINSEQDMHNVALRMSILNREYTVIGMGSSLPSLDLVKGLNIITAQMNIDCLAPGQYVIKLVLYEVGEFGANKNLDVIDEACAFEKIQMNENNKMVWNHKWWGYLTIPEITLTKQN